jgi:membrane protein implicated in regulation of membrane protease activity
MENTDYIWIITNLTGIVLGLFFKPKMSSLIVLALLILGAIGFLIGIYAAWIPSEHLWLLVMALPMSITVFGAAVLTSLCLMLIKRAIGRSQSQSRSST